MIQQRNSRPIAFILIGATILALLLFVQPARAEALFQGDGISAGDSIEGDVFLSGDDVQLAGDVSGDAFIVGRKITVSGDVKGSLFALGENIVLSGEVEGSLYALGGTLSLSSDAMVGRSVYFVGLTLSTEQDSTIGLDLNTLAFGARQAGSVGGDTKAIIGLVEIARHVFDSVSSVTTGKSLQEALSPASSSAEPALLIASFLPAGRSSSALSPPLAQDDEPTNLASDQATAWLVGRLREMISYLLVGGLALWLLPVLFLSWSGTLQRKPLPSLGWGLVFYVMGFAGSFILLVLVVAIGAGLAALTLWPLAWSWWAVGLSAVALTFAIFLALVAFVSKAIVAYLIGELILARFSRSAAASRFWPLLLGIFLLVLVGAIPYLGWAVGLIATLFGLGAIWLTFTGRRTATLEEE